MLKKIITVVLLLIVTYYSEAQTTLRLRNNTGKEIYSSYVVWDNQYSCWVSRGWYKIKAYRYEDFDLGNYEGLIYTHAIQHGITGDTKWGTEKYFCINPTDGYEIYYAGKLNCNTTAMFSSLRVTEGVNTYFFQP